jgi:hypothetical protein
VKQTVSPTITSTPSPTLPNTDTEYDESEDVITMEPNLDYGTYEKPHKIGESVRVAYLYPPMSNQKVDFDIVFETVLSGDEAKKKA